MSTIEAAKIKAWAAQAQAEFSEVADDVRASRQGGHPDGKPAGGVIGAGDPRGAPLQNLGPTGRHIESKAGKRPSQKSSEQPKAQLLPQKTKKDSCCIIS